MKNHSFNKRLGYAWNGVRSAYQRESSFRTQCNLAILAFVLLIALRPTPIWWALISVITAAILAAELINTALESVLDHINPSKDPLIGLAKDCAAGAVLVLSISSLVVAVAMILSTL